MPAYAASDGLLTPTLTTPGGTADLSTEGSTDWVHWGLTTASSINRKAGVTPRIGALTAIGGSASRFLDSGVRLAYAWSDGTPTATASTRAGLYIAGLNKGYALTAPADTVERTLVVYLGGFKTRGRIEVSLSDNSAPVYSQTVENLDAAFDRRLALTYRAAGAGQTLTVRYIQDRSGGNVTFQAATLQGGGTPPVNQPPVLAPIGNRSVQVGNTLSIAVSATDPDGPAPLVLAAAPLPAAASFVDNGNGTGQFSWTPASGALAGSPYSITFTATDAGGAGLSTSETIAVTVTAASTGLLTPTLTTPGGTADLSSEGSTDWVHWGLTTASSVNRKAGVTPRIGALAAIGGSASRFLDSGVRLAYAWSDGTPTATASTRAGLFIAGVNKGYALTAPADTAERTLVVYLGGFKTRGRIEVSLSDNSAPVYSQTVENLDAAFDRRLALTYRAAGAGQTLTVRYLQDVSTGNVTFQAATLQGSDTPPPVNQPPVLAPIGNRSVQVGNTLSITVSATDPDGPAPLVLAAAPLPAAASFVDNGNGTGQFSWTPASGALAGSPYSITFTATDAGGAGLSTSETIAVTVTAASDGLLTPTLTTPGGTADLSTEGSTDWVHWGLTTASSVNRKAGVTPRIGALTAIGGSASRFLDSGVRLAYAWSDGTPTATASTRAGLYIAGLNKGYALTAPADTVERTLVVYLGGFKTRGRIEVSLSDNSAPVYSQTVENLDAAFDRRLALTYRAAGAGQTLTVRYIQDRSGGNVTFQAATLQGGGTPPVNQPPVLAPIGNRSVQVGNTLSIAVSATDPDGPAPLVLAAAPLPAAASFVDNGNGTGQFSWTPASGALAGSPYSITFTATDAGGAGLSTSETIAVTVTAASTGLLTPTLTTPGGTADLSSEGSTDWVHWGLTTASSVNRKAGVTPRIGALTAIGGSASRFLDSGVRLAYAWSDGTPTATASTRAGLFIAGVNKGYALTAPADTTERTLVVYLGGFKTRGRIEVSLSDNSAPVYSQTVENLDAAFDRRLALTYRAAGAGQTLTVRYLQDVSTGNVTFQAATLVGGAADPGFTLPFLDDFSDGNMNGWSIVDETNQPSDWSVSGGWLRQNWRIESKQAFDQTYHLGSYAYLGAGLALTDYRFSVDAQYLATGLAEDIGILFRFRDPENYYRLSINSRYGFTRLEKRVNGVFSALATDSRGYSRDELLNLEVEVRGSQILILRNADPLFAVTDTSHSFGTIGLYTQDQARFDNVRIETPASSPAVVLRQPLAYLTTSGTTIQAAAIAANAPTGAAVAFLLNGNLAAVDASAPFQIEIPSVSPGNHTVTAILRNASGAEIARDTNVVVGLGGEYLVGIGDSITNGIGDNYALDNRSERGRVVGFQGYQAVLTDLLDASAPALNTAPANLVFNEGIGGDESFEAAFWRVDSIKARHGAMDTALIMVGTNDANVPIPSGLGCVGTSACGGTFKANLQTLVDKIRWANYPTNSVASGVTPIVALPPPTWNSTTPYQSSTNNLIREYIEVIVSEIAGIVVGPDFFDYFLPSPTSNYRSLFADTLHPNGLGYRVMSSLWHNALSPTAQVALPFVVDGISLSTGKQAQQNLLEPGNRLYIDAAFTLLSAPVFLDEGRWIMTSNATADRNSTGSTYMSFSIDRDADVFVAYDAGASALPGWLSNFENTGQNVTTTNANAPSLRIYRKFYSAGEVVLGGNLNGSALGAKANYVVIVRER
ncbi:SGNH/GDSL hydrolase family protein [Thiocapsa rosea]|uniref:Lysophospholipase L1-like esterase n=1 Tax=Thiocapsa rosea TaxID=69360 RepID=A0A495VDX6_9GAMM|nr:SGNH/GDSL hydrolase family protein [Thiocapsa rosea]RKT47464.1 lysophospholipase L1-like esterase [Thiocapsa rosea]